MSAVRGDGVQAGDPLSVEGGHRYFRRFRKRRRMTYVRVNPAQSRSLAESAAAGSSVEERCEAGGTAVGDYTIGRWR
jgi:hypothetical protein